MRNTFLLLVLFALFTSVRIYAQDPSVFYDGTSGGWVGTAGSDLDMGAYDILMGSTSKIDWSTRADISSNGDGQLLIELNDNSNGVTLDVAEAAGQVTFRNQADSAYAGIRALNVSALGSYFSAAAGAYVGWAGRSALRSPSDGEVKVSNYANTAAFCMSADTDGEMRVYASNCSSAGKIRIDSTEYIQDLGNRMTLTGYNGGGAILNADSNVANAAIFHVLGQPTSEMTDTDATQYGIVLTPHVNQSGTAVFKAFYANVTDTASGSGQDYLMDLNWGSSPMFQVEDDGDTHIYGNARKGQSLDILTKTESVTFAGDASKTTTGSILPDGAFLIGVTGRVTTALTNCTSVDVGDGVDQDLFAKDLAIAIDSTFGPTDAQAATPTVANGYWPRWTDGELTVTAIGGNCNAGVVALTVHYFELSPATSN